MNVYAIHAYGNYGGGMAVVAAPSKEIATELAQKKENSVWNVNYLEPNDIEILPVEYEGLPCVLTSFETGE